MTDPSMLETINADIERYNEAVREQNAWFQIFRVKFLSTLEKIFGDDRCRVWGTDNQGNPRDEDAVEPKYPDSPVYTRTLYFEMSGFHHGVFDEGERIFKSELTISIRRFSDGRRDVVLALGKNNLDVIALDYSQDDMDALCLKFVKRYFEWLTL